MCEAFCHLQRTAICLKWWSNLFFHWIIFFLFSTVFVKKNSMKQPTNHKVTNLVAVKEGISAILNVNIYLLKPLCSQTDIFKCFNNKIWHTKQVVTCLKPVMFVHLSEENRIHFIISLNFRLQVVTIYSKVNFGIQFGLSAWKRPTLLYMYFVRCFGSRASSVPHCYVF